MGVPRRERAARVAELLDLVGLSDRAQAYPAQLSGGQKQRVGIARALAGRPSVLLSDEATSALDPETTTSILELLRDLNRRLGLTILLITHEMEVVKRICDSAAVMREGRIIESGRVRDLVARPGSALGQEIFRLGPPPDLPDTTIVDVTLTDDAVGQSFVADLVRRYDVDASILAGTIETLADGRVGRLRIALPGGAEANAEPLRHLREAGLTVEVAR
jgi:D-methionine transport system ATP-binding protein